MSRGATGVVIWTLLLAFAPSGNANAQVPSVIVEAAPWVGRGVVLIGKFLAQYAAGKEVDLLLGTGAALRDTISDMRDQLRFQARVNATDRQLLVRQAAILDQLQSDLDLLVRRRPPEAEADDIGSRAADAIRDILAVQADYGRRIGRLEEGQDSLRRLLASATGQAGSQEGASRPDSGAAGCAQTNVGHFGFTNPKTTTRFTVIVYYREGSDSSRTLIVPPGATQYVFDFPAGAHNYVVTYRAQVPIMSFPPGAPTVERDVVYLRGQIYVEPCKSGALVMN